MTDLVLSAPATFIALLDLLQAAGAAQSPAVAVYAFALGEEEPAAYVLLRNIANHSITWATMGDFGQVERYDITGIATVFSGSSPTDDPTVMTDVLTQTYALLQAVVLGPVIADLTTLAPGTTGSPYDVLPKLGGYSAAPGNVDGGPAGWGGIVGFSFHFDARLSTL